MATIDEMLSEAHQIATDGCTEIEHCREYVTFRVPSWDWVLGQRRLGIGRTLEDAVRDWFAAMAEVAQHGPLPGSYGEALAIQAARHSTCP